ncbi:MAG: hypothetical protein ACEPOZ_18590 [Marinifilaceae bacterium]|jgi:hypothetical protein
MNCFELIRMALNLPQNWEISRIEFAGKETQSKSLHININYTGGSNLTNTLGENYAIHDSIDRTFRHLNFFQHNCYIHCKVPRIREINGKIRQVQIPWSIHPSGFMAV